jgi:hypothetical protein
LAYCAEAQKSVVVASLRQCALFVRCACFALSISLPFFALSLFLALSSCHPRTVDLQICKLEKRKKENEKI